MGMYAPQRKPYPALTIVPTADICPCVERKKFMTEDSAVPNSTRSTMSSMSRSTSDSVM